MLRAFMMDFAACAFWLVAIGAGLVGVSGIRAERRAPGVQICQWPVESPIALAKDRNTLLMFAHPHCPCTKASLQELKQLIEKSHPRVAVQILFLSPSGYPSKWTLNDLWRSATAIPGAKVGADADGLVSSQFGADASGCVMLFNPRGERLFRGGITEDCVSAGDNASAASLLALLTGRESGPVQTPVYGRLLPLESQTAQANDTVPRGLAAR